MRRRSATGRRRAAAVLFASALLVNACGSTGTPATGIDEAPRTSASGDDRQVVVPSVPAPPAEAPVETVPTGDGFLVISGDRTAGQGRTVTFTVEVEPAADLDPAEVAAVADDALFDHRSWGRDVTLRRIADPDAADIRLVFATPATVDRLCGQAGLDTEGSFSCFTGPYAGNIAAINAWRYREGAADFDGDLPGYRRYVINHEFGHGLDHRHTTCPEPGAAAPAMMQQTISTGECEPNSWPYPDAEQDGV